MENNKGVIYSLFFTFLIGCASTQSYREAPKMVSLNTGRDGIKAVIKNPKNAISKYSTIAIIEFKSPENEPIAGIEIADRIGIFMMKKGYTVVEREYIKSLLKERYLNYLGVIDPGKLKEFKAISGADALITGTIGAYQSGIGGSSYQYGNIGSASTNQQSEVSLTLKMFDLENGEILFSASGSRSGASSRGGLIDDILDCIFLNFPKR